MRQIREVRDRDQPNVSQLTFLSLSNVSQLTLPCYICHESFDIMVGFETNREGQENVTKLTSLMLLSHASLTSWWVMSQSALGLSEGNTDAHPPTTGGREECLWDTREPRRQGRVLTRRWRR